MSSTLRFCLVATALTACTGGSSGSDETTSEATTAASPTVAAATASSPSAASADLRAAREAADAPARHSVLLLTIDALRNDMPWTSYERPIAPNLTKLAERAFVFEQHRANASFTAQSVAAILSGRLASTLYRTGYFFAAYGPDNLFFTESLQQAGARTIGLHAHHYFRADRKGLNQGFDVWELVRGESADPWSIGPATPTRPRAEPSWRAAGSSSGTVPAMAGGTSCTT